MEDKSDFAFQKKIGIVDLPYQTASIVLDVLHRLFVCMKETNDLHKVSCEFFRLDFRQTYFDEQMEFPIRSLILDLKWGSKKELDNLNAKDGE